MSAPGATRIEGWRDDAERYYSDRPARIDVVAVLTDPHFDGQWRGNLLAAAEAVAELMDCVGDAQALLTEIDAAVRKEHAKNGAPQSKSVAGIVSERLAAAVARCGGAA